MPTNLILADDHPIVLRGLQQLLELEKEFDVVATCQDGRAVVRTVREHDADILVLDLRLPGKDGIAVMEDLKRQKVSIRVVLLTAAIEEPDLLRAVRLGVAGIVLKDMAPDVLLTCLRKVRAGGQWIELDSLVHALDNLLRRETGARDMARLLTAREMEITRLVAKGLRNAEIAVQLGISEGTVKVHLHNIYEKLRVDGRVELILCAQERGLA